MPVSIGRPRSRKGRSQRVSDFDFRTWIRPWGFEYCLPSSRFWLRFSGYGVGRRWPVKGVGRHRQVNAAKPARALAAAPEHHRDQRRDARWADDHESTSHRGTARWRRRRSTGVPPARALRETGLRLRRAPPSLLRSSLIGLKLSRDPVAPAPGDQQSTRAATRWSNEGSQRTMRVRDFQES